MDLLKVSISKDARVDRLELKRAMEKAGWAPETIDLLPARSAPADNLRCALTYQLRPWQRFTVGTMRCSASAKQTTRKTLDRRVQVECIAHDGITHTEDLAVIRETSTQEQKDGHGAFLTEYSTNIPLHFRGLVDHLDSPALVRFGEKYFFEGDLRRFIDDCLEGVCLPLWDGIRLVLTPEASAKVQALQRLLGALDAGRISLNLLSLDNTPANREALGRELAEQFLPQLEKLTERCSYPAPNLASIQSEYDALQAKIALVETTLGVELDCVEAQFDVEVALNTAQAA